MTPQELKNSILQLAIQGKLVEQCHEEGTGEELLQHIQAEKQALIRAGKIKNEKTLAAVSEDEVPYDIPENWKWVKLGELCSILTGKKDANFGSDTGEYYFFTCAKEPIRCDSFSFSGEAILMAGNGDIGNLSYYYGDFEAYQRTYVLQPYIEFSYLKYILYHLLCNWVSYNNDKTFGTAIPYIRLGNVQNYLVALPPLAEQKRIVAKIEELLPLIDRYEQAWSKLEDFNKRFPVDMQKSILQMAIQGKLVPQLPEEGTGEELFAQIQAEKQTLIKAGTIKKEKPLPEITEDEIPFDIPESWKWAKIGEIFSVIRGSSPRPKGSPLYWSSTPTKHHWVTIKDITSFAENGFLFQTHEFLTDEGAKKSTFVSGGELIIAVSGSTTGKFCILGIDGYIYDGLAAIINPTNIIGCEYLKYFFTWIYERLNAQKIGSAFPNINTDMLKNTLIPLPPLAEQKRIVAKLEEILPLCERLK